MRLSRIVTFFAEKNRYKVTVIGLRRRVNWGFVPEELSNTQAAFDGTALRSANSGRPETVDYNY
ncbi:MAG: hypothetical protein J5654_02515 [Victivallales bacterium]|nr:hypothetical protein [Victivallales bacterium]